MNGLGISIALVALGSVVIAVAVVPRDRRKKVALRTLGIVAVILMGGITLVNVVLTYSGPYRTTTAGSAIGDGTYVFIGFIVLAGLIITPILLLFLIGRNRAVGRSAALQEDAQDAVPRPPDENSSFTPGTGSLMSPGVDVTGNPYSGKIDRGYV